MLPKTSYLKENTTFFKGTVTNIIEQENKIVLYIKNKES